MRLFISSIGMITSVGHDVQTACASARAGIMRTNPTPHFLTSDDGNPEPVAVSGCMVTPHTDGFGSVPRWQILGQRAFQDMVNYGQLPSAEHSEFWHKTAVIFALPSLDEANFDFEGVIDSDTVKPLFVAPFINAINVPIPQQYCTVVAEDDTAVVSALEKVAQVFKHEMIERCIVLAIDSLLEGHRLQWLDIQGRIKKPDNPVGLMPGEAAVALLFEKEETLAARNTQALARVYGYSTTIEPNNYASEEPNTGQGLTTSVRKTLSSVNMESAYAGTIYSDLNGEEWRAQEYAMTRLNLINKQLNQTLYEVFPAESIGDVGVATPACALCMLIESNRRNYAFSADALILASSAAGQASSLLARAY